MNTLKKTIFLTNEEKNKGMGLLTLENKNNNIFATLKVYQQYPSSNYILGIKYNDKIIKQNINLDNSTYNFIINEKINLDTNLGCVLLEQKESNIKPILWGSEKSQSYKSSIINNLRENIAKIGQSNSLVKQIKQENSPSSSIRNIQSKTLPQSSHDTHFNVNTLNAFKAELDDIAISPIQNITLEQYKSLSQISMQEELLAVDSGVAVASSPAQLFETSDEDLEEVIDNSMQQEVFQFQPHAFYDMIAEQIEELFEKYPREHNLSRLIENSKWVKIDKDGDTKHYVVGIIIHNNDIKYICYGVPGTYSNEPPQELMPYSQWLPTDTKDPYNNGYWVMYQDADTGENIYLN